MVRKHVTPPNGSWKRGMAVEHVAGAAGGQILTDSRDTGAMLKSESAFKGQT